MTPPNAQNAVATALGSKAVTVTFLDGRNAEVLVKQLPIRKMREYGKAVEDPADVIALCTGKTGEWIDTLTPDSFATLANAADELNSDFFVRWMVLGRERAERIRGQAVEAGVVLPTVP